MPPTLPPATGSVKPVKDIFGMARQASGIHSGWIFAPKILLGMKNDSA